VENNDDQGANKGGIATSGEQQQIGNNNGRGTTNRE
jgi:hypothetical protein